MSKNPQDKNRMPGQGESEGEEMEKTPRKDLGEQKKGQQRGQGQTGQQNCNKEQGDPTKREEWDPMHRQKDTDEETGDDRKKRPA